jgi:hypothetical protein
MNYFFSINKMTSLLNFIEQGLNIKIPMLQQSFRILILLLESNLPGQSIDLSLYSIVDHHVAYLSLSSIDVHSNQSWQSLQINAAVVFLNHSQIMLD